MKKFFYPDNLQAENLFAKYWNVKDLGILLAIFIIAIFMFLFFQIWLFGVLFIFYGIVSAKLVDGYSISKLAKLYIRFLITDVLILKWR